SQPIPVGRLNNRNRTFIFVAPGSNPDEAPSARVFLCPPELLPKSLTETDVDNMIAHNEGVEKLKQRKSLSTFRCKEVSDLEEKLEPPSKKIKIEGTGKQGTARTGKGF